MARHLKRPLLNYRVAADVMTEMPDPLTEGLLYGLLEGKPVPYGTDQLDVGAAPRAEVEIADNRVEWRVKKTTASRIDSPPRNG